MIKDEAYKIDVDRFATRLWILVEEIHSLQAFLSKYEEFDRQLWELCVDYPDIDEQSLSRVAQVMEKRHGYRFNTLGIQHAMSELHKIVSPEEVLASQTVLAEGNLSKTDHRLYQRIFARLRNWLSACNPSSSLQPTLCISRRLRSLLKKIFSFITFCVKWMHFLFAVAGYLSVPEKTCTTELVSQLKEPALTR